MGEPTQVAFKHREVVEALIKQQDLHEGIWALNVTFNWQATNVGTSPELFPAIIAAVVQLGLNKSGPRKQHCRRRLEGEPRTAEERWRGTKLNDPSPYLRRITMALAPAACNRECNQPSTRRLRVACGASTGVHLRRFLKHRQPLFALDHLPCSTQG
jgi:hypothetical protein